jgi:hypothetical protein
MIAGKGVRTPCSGVQSELEESLRALPSAMVQQRVRTASARQSEQQQA